MKKYLWIIWVSIILGLLGGFQSGIRSASDATTTGGAILLFCVEELFSVFGWLVIGAIVYAILTGVSKSKNKSIEK